MSKQPGVCLGVFHFFVVSVLVFSFSLTSVNAAVPISSEAIQDRRALSAAEKSLGLAVQTATKSVTSAQILTGIEAAKQRATQLKASPFAMVMISSAYQNKTKHHIIIDGSKSVAENVAFIDQAIEAMKNPPPAAKPAELTPEEKAAAEKKPEKKFDENGEEILQLDKFEVLGDRVEDLNFAPMGTANVYEIHRNGTVEGFLDASDAEDDSRDLGYRIVEEPTSGAITLFDARSGEFKFQPEKNFTGTATFKFVAHDDRQDSAVSTITVNVTKAPPLHHNEAEKHDLSKQRQIDLIFVIDDSRSMANNQKLLAQTFERFIKLFGDRSSSADTQKSNADLDYRIGVLSTDCPRLATEHNFDNCVKTEKNDGSWKNLRNDPFGELLPLDVKFQAKDASSKMAESVLREPYLTSATPNLNEAFQSYVKLGIDGSGNETGLLPIIHFLGLSQAKGSRASQFLREGALTVFVVVSDEDEQRGFGSSPSKLLSSVVDKTGATKEMNDRLDQLEKALIAAKGAKGRFRFYAVTELPRKGAAANSKAGGYVYRKAAERLGGSSIDINQDFSEDLMMIGKDMAQNAAYSFALSNSPQEGTLQVLINGHVQKLGTDFTYNEQSQSVVLIGEAMSRSFGAQVEVRYEWIQEIE